MTRRVTNGELRSFKRCKRRWWLTWYRRLRPVAAGVTGAAPLGTRVHKAMQALYSGQDPWAALDAQFTKDAEAIGENYEKFAELTKEDQLARIMVEGYLEWAAETGIDQGLTIVAAETRIEAPFPAIPGVNVMGKIDVRVIRDVDNARLFLDHKTVGDLTSPVKMLHMDEQMLHYHMLEYLDYLQRLELGEEQLPPRCEGALYNMLRKVKRTVKAKPPFYDRFPVPHNVHQLRSYYVRVYGEVMDILTAEARLAAGEDHRVVAYPNPTRECTWQCEFFAVCPIMDESPEAAEHFLRDWFKEADPLDRYEDTTDSVI